MTPIDEEAEKLRKANEGKGSWWVVKDLWRRKVAKYGLEVLRELGDGRKLKTEDELIRKYSPLKDTYNIAISLPGTFSDDAMQPTAPNIYAHSGNRPFGTSLTSDNANSLMRVPRASSNNIAFLCNSFGSNLGNTNSTLPSIPIFSSNNDTSMPNSSSSKSNCVNRTSNTHPPDFFSNLSQYPVSDPISFVNTSIPVKYVPLLTPIGSPQALQRPPIDPIQNLTSMGFQQTGPTPYATPVIDQSFQRFDNTPSDYNNLNTLNNENNVNNIINLNFNRNSANYMLPRKPPSGYNDFNSSPVYPSTSLTINSIPSISQMDYMMKNSKVPGSNNSNYLYTKVHHGNMTSYTIPPHLANPQFERYESERSSGGNQFQQPHPQG
jgi:hypothetical protein